MFQPRKLKRSGSAALRSRRLWRHYHEEAARIRREAKIVASEQVRLQLLAIAHQYDLLADSVERAGLYKGHPPI